MAHIEQFRSERPIGVAWMVLTAVSVLAMAGCQSRGVSTRADAAQLSVWVSNQSLEFDPVDIRVSVQDRVIADEVFLAGTQHSWKVFDVGVQRGDVRVSASANGGAITEDTLVSISDSLWVTVAFWAQRPDASDGLLLIGTHTAPPAIK